MKRRTMAEILDAVVGDTSDTQTIMIRNVPCSVHDALHHLAIDKRVSLNTLLLDILVRAAKKREE